MKKPTAADRPAFRREMRGMLRDLKVQITELDSDMTIVCARASDFDPANNVLWELEGNKSAVRDDVQCTDCKSPVAMSHDAYARFRALDRKPTVCCTYCLAKSAGVNGKDSL